ncbi:hypothetical protein L2E82_08877 [Cichorium intybus]|uniref:Uncharacterized protein n=1 Tax=Cichorium intybus TaxID=13427 RepID=A0ACB9G6W0_CICIN|nr:hypothetical protein L2E82_08877 [Cichorium intybus]
MVCRVAKGLRWWSVRFLSSQCVFAGMSSFLSRFLLVAFPFGRVAKDGALVVSRLESWWCHVGASRSSSSRRDQLLRRVAIAGRFLVFCLCFFFTSRPLYLSRRDCCSSVILLYFALWFETLLPQIFDVVANCNLLTAFVGCDFVVSSFVRFVMPDDEAFLDLA